MLKTNETNEHHMLDINTLTDQQALAISKYYSGIDWASLFFRLLEKIHWILLAAVLSAIAMMLYLRFQVTPIYQATSKLYIAGSENSISLSDLQLGSTLAKDYQEVFKIWHIHELVDEKLELSYSYNQLGSMVTVSVPDGSHVLYIQIQSPDPEEARQLADTYAEVVQDFIANKMELRKPQLLEKAQKPNAPISPNVKQLVITGFFVGGLAAAALIVFLYLVDDKIRTSEDIEKVSDIAVLGMITRQIDENTPGKSDDSVGSNFQPSIQEGPTAVFHSNFSVDYSAAEAVNMVCSSITFAGKNLKKLAVTSGEAGNGKTFVTLQIAREMGRRGKRVLLIDADLRKSVLLSKYNIELSNGKYGLAHYLSGQCGMDDIIYKTNVPNLSLIPVGRNVKTPLPLLTSDEFGQLLLMLETSYDYILIDTPPLGMVIDGAEIAQKCDGSILVLEYNLSTIHSLRNMQRLLEQAGSPIIGCVINKVVMKGLVKNRYYYQYGTYEYAADSKAQGKTHLGFHGKKGRKAS